MLESFETAAPNPIDEDELVWLALSHLSMPPGAFAEHLAEPLLDATAPHCGLVRCNPLLQLRSLLVDFAFVEAFAEKYRAASLASLRELLARHEVALTGDGRFRCDIYTKKRFHEDVAWARLRELAAATLVEAGLPPWQPMPDRLSYLPYATWDEDEDLLYAVIAEGGRIADLPWHRNADPALWTPSRRR